MVDLFDNFEIDVDQDRLDGFFDSAGQFVDEDGGAPDTITLDLTRQLDRSCLVKFYNMMFDIERSMAIQRRIEELDALGIDTEVVS